LHNSPARTEYVPGIHLKTFGVDEGYGKVNIANEEIKPGNIQIEDTRAIPADNGHKVGSHMITG
jgi:hypothetical protein